MAVKYVSDFSFPSDFGFHKNGSSSVPGKAKGGHATTPQRYAKGGTATPTSKYSGHTKGAPNIAKQGAGASDLKRPAMSDHRFKGTQGEKSSGMEKPAFAKGGHAKGCGCKMCGGGLMKKAEGGSTKVAAGAVAMGKKSSWNKDDAVSPGSYKRTPPAQGMKNKAAASDRFASRDTDPATEQKGSVQRMSGWSDFKRGGKVHKKAAGGHMDPAERKAMKPDRKRNMGANPQAPGKDTKPSSTPYDYKKGGQVKTQDRFEDSDGSGSGKNPRGSMSKDIAGTSKQVKGDGMGYKKGGRIANLGKYAHGGKVWTDGSTQKPGGDDKFEKAAGTPKKSHDGSKGERSSGTAVKSSMKAQGEKRMAGGGLTRATSAKRNAAIHAKEHKQKGPGMGAIAALLGGSSMPHQPPAPGIGSAPPGMAPGMGSPPGGAMGGMSPQGPGGPPAMAHGGGVKHVMIHHISHKM